MQRLRTLPRNVLILGMVSLLTDVSSEMIYPLLPLFLTVVLGAGPAFLGAIEGVAESTAALLKLASGVVSDRVAGASRWCWPATGSPPWPGRWWHWPPRRRSLLGVRFCDRIGKGVRTSPRDALIADSVAPELRGRAYGFHRSMDHAGALLGPLVAAGLLGWYGLDLRTVFWCAAVPGLLAVLLIALQVRVHRTNRRAASPQPLGTLPARAVALLSAHSPAVHARQLVRRLSAAQSVRFGVTPARGFRCSGHFSIWSRCWRLRRAAHFPTGSADEGSLSPAGGFMPSPTSASPSPPRVAHLAGCSPATDCSTV